MRTNIVIEDELMEEARKLTGIKTKRKVVDKALRLLVEIGRQQSILSLEGTIQWDGDLDASREGRFINADR